MTEWLHQLAAVGLLDQSVVTSISPTIHNDYHPRIQSEAQEHGSDLEVRFIGADAFMNAYSDMNLYSRIWSHG